MLLTFTDVFVVYSAYFFSGSFLFFDWPDVIYWLPWLFLPFVLTFCRLVERVSTFPPPKKLSFNDGPWCESLLVVARSCYRGPQSKAEIIQLVHYCYGCSVFPLPFNSELIHNSTKTTDTTIISKSNDCRICVAKTFKVSDASVQRSLRHLGSAQLSVSKLTTLTQTSE